MSNATQDQEEQPTVDFAIEQGLHMRPGATLTDPIDTWTLCQVHCDLDVAERNLDSFQKFYSDYTYRLVRRTITREVLLPKPKGEGV